MHYLYKAGVMLSRREMKLLINYSRDNKICELANNKNNPRSYSRFVDKLVQPILQLQRYNLRFNYNGDRSNKFTRTLIVSSCEKDYIHSQKNTYD